MWSYSLLMISCCFREIFNCLKGNVMNRIFVVDLQPIARTFKLSDHQIKFYVLINEAYPIEFR